MMMNTQNLAFSEQIYFDGFFWYDIESGFCWVAISIRQSDKKRFLLWFRDKAEKMPK
jgi:hypothetical protein